MASNGARHLEKPRRNVLAAYLRALGEGRTRSAIGLEALRERIEPQLRSVVADALGVEPVDLTKDTSLLEDLAADSLDVLDVLVRVEEAFDVIVPEREIAACVTYGDLAATTTALIACRLRARAADAAGSRVEVAIGRGDAPRFVRVFEASPYDRELLNDDLRTARADEQVAIRAPGQDRQALCVERTLVRARLAGADVRTPAEQPGEPFDRRGGEEISRWPARRLAGTTLLVVDALREERDLAVAHLALADGALGDDVAEARATSDRQVRTFRAVVETYVDVLDDARATLHAAARELGRLAAVRRAVDERTVGVHGAREAYDTVGDVLLGHVRALESLGTVTRMRLPQRPVVPGQDDEHGTRRPEVARA
jgi:acyl carrier protein